MGMQPCEGTEAVPPNARSHTVLLAGTFVGNQSVLVRLSFGIDAGNQVCVRVCMNMCRAKLHIVGVTPRVPSHGAVLASRPGGHEAGGPGRHL